MKGFADKFKSALLAAIFLSGAPAAIGQRSFNVSIALTNSGPTISWKAQSATPNGDLLIVPEFRVERSPDLNNWTPVSGILTASSIGQKMSFADTNNAVAFYRVQSILDLEYAQLDKVTLNNGGLAARISLARHFLPRTSNRPTCRARSSPPRTSGRRISTARI